MKIPSAKKRGFAFLPVLIILASVLIGTGSVLLLREKINEEQGASFKGQEASFDEQETSFEEQGTRDEGQVARDKEQETSFDEQGGSDEEQVARDKEQGGSGEQISNFNESNNSEQVNKNTNENEISSSQSEPYYSEQANENTNNNEISSTSVVEGEKIESKIQDLPSKIYLEADNDGKDELNLGRTLKIKGGEGIKTSLSNNTITITNTGNTSPNSTVTVTESTDYDFDVNQFEVSDNAVSIKDIFVKRTDSILIPGSNISTLTNDSGYITDGNTNWDNSYGYITASSSDALTNKTGNISMWTNDSGYITGSSSSALTNKTGNISMWTNDSGYITDGNTNWDNSYGFITDGNTNWDNSYGYITASSSDALTNKSGNISQWTNNSGYITDGNTGWDNSYNFITASSSDALTNKTGNISMWTNDANFITLTSLSSSATGLTYTNTTGVFSLSSGYVIPTTTQETNWGTAYTNRVDTWNYPLSISSNAVSLGYNTTNLKITSNQLNTIQDIATTSSPAFTNLSLSNNLLISGKVGIGSTDPQKKLEINDNDADTTTSGVRFGNFVCTSSDKLTVDVNGDIVCATDQTGSGTGNIIDTLADTLAAGNNANSLNITNIGRLYTAIGLVGTPSFSFQSDQDTGMYSSGTDTLNFTTGGAERMRIGSTGNVGVGTTNPSSKLHVAGNTLTEGNILPEMTGATGFVSTRTIGDTNNRFSDIWTEEMHIGASSLYVNGKKVISDVSDVMNFTTDTDQSMIIKSVGSGNLTMQTDTGTLFLTGSSVSATNTNFTVNATNQFSATGKGGIGLTVPSDNPSQNLNLVNNSANGDIYLSVTGTGSQIINSATDKISLTAPTISLLGHVGIGTTDAVKNLTVSGTINTATISGGTLTSSAVNGVTTANILTTGSSFSGDVSGTYNNLVVADDSHAHTTTTISGLDISSDTNLSGDTEIVLTGDALSIAGSITRDSEIANFITASSSDALTNKTGNISMWTNDANFITLTSLSSSATGLTYTNTTGVFSLSSGYVIPTTTQETNWGTAYTNRVDTWNYPLSISSNAVSLGYNTTNLKLTSNQLNTIQDIASTSTPTFGGMTLNGTLTLGTYSLTTSNNTVVANFNADLLDGQEGSYYAAASSISGTTNYLAKFSGTGAVGNSIVFDNGTNVGIGTTAPAQKLHVEGHCITGDSLLSVIPADRVKRILDDRSWILEEQEQEQILKDLKNRSLITKKQIKDVVPGDYVYSLDEKTGQTTPNRINKLLDMGVQPVFELTTESGKKIQTTGNHPYFSILNNQTNGAVQIRGIEGLAKRSGLSPDDLSADKEFSQTRTLWTNRPDQKSLNLSSSQLSGGTGETTQERIHSVLLQQSGQSLRNSNGSQDSSEAGLSQGGTNQNNYQQNSRNTQTTKRSDSLLEKAEWTKVIDLIEGDYIATVKDLRSNNKDQVVWEKISNIKYVGKKQVYDIEVKDTHNFIANEIFAHNTYISGNVGIGTTSPEQLLHVGSSSETVDKYIKIQTAGTYKSGVQFVGGTANIWHLAHDDNNANLQIGMDSSEFITVNSTGNVGIGTTAPSSKLEVKGSTSSGDESIVKMRYGHSPAIGDDLNFDWINYSDGLALGRIGVVADASGDWNMDFSTTTNSGSSLTQVMRLTDDGNVGIGTTNPTEKLTLENGLLKISKANNTDNNSPGLVYFSDDDFSYNGLYLNHYGFGFHDPTVTPGHSGSYVSGYFGIDLFTGGSNRLSINDIGNVGIGTTAPAYHLQVESTSDNQFQVLGKGTSYGGTVLANIYSERNVAGANALLKVGSAYAPNAFYIQDSGNVGIGTTAPNNKLEVYGTSTAPDLSSYTGLANVHGSVGVELEFGSGSSSPYGMWMQSSNHYGTAYPLNLNPLGGNVGIGTTSPGNTLQVNGGITMQNSVDNSFVMNHSGTNGNNWAISNIAGAGNAGGMRFYNGTNTAEYMRITNSGNVGIGTTSPATKLHVDFGSQIAGSYGDAATAIKITGTNDASSVYGGIVWKDTDSGGTEAFGIYPIRTGSGINRLDITNNQAPLMTILGGGNVGIGTTNPVAKLDTRGEAYFEKSGVANSTYTFDSIGYSTNNPFPSQGGNTDWSGLILNQGFNNGGFYHLGFSIYTDNQTSPTYATARLNSWRDVAGPYPNLELAASNNIWLSANKVGIGTTAPGYKLTLNGQPAANGYTAWTNYSDSRLKENITPLVNGSVLDKISQLNPVTFNYNSLTGYDAETRARRVSGFIAQDLQKVFPEMVGETQINGTTYLDINLSDLQLYLLEGIQELAVQTSSINNNWVMQNGQIKITSLEDQIAELNNEWVINNGEDEIEQLKARVAELEAQGSSSKEQETIDQTDSNDNNSGEDNENVNENLNLNENLNSNNNENDNSNDNLNIDQKINDQLSLLGIGDIGGTVTAFFKEVWFEAKVTFEKAVVFAAEVTFGGRVTFQDQDMGGKTVIESGTDSVTVTFAKPFTKTPVITLTPEGGNTDFYLTETSEKGFTIKINQPSAQNITFNWIALEIGAAE